MSMEIKDGERVVVAKPVASRPSCSTFRSFSELLAGAINASPSTVSSESAIAAIRPKTVRFNPTMNRAQGEMSGSKVHDLSGNVLKDSELSTPTVVYKPLAKLVSKTTVSLLANMGNSSSHQHHQLEALRVLPPNHEKQNFIGSQVNSNLGNNVTSTDQTSESSKATPMEEDPKSLPPTTASVDRPSYDGYNWRKYGQKQVKGSEYPRSYYKCTHPNCPVKKKVERAFDGQIAEIVYKGEHNHSKPQPPKRNSSGTQGSGLQAPEGNGRESSEGRMVNDGNEVGLMSEQLAHRGNGIPAYDPAVNGAMIPPEDSCGISGECEDASKGIEAENSEHRNKRRKTENVGNINEGVQEPPRIVVQSNTETEIIGDGFRWRKYGQKVVKGNPYPRSYYRCTGLKCNVRKHVERTSDDPKAFITTYEGKHNHDMPQKTANASTSEQDSQVAAKDKVRLI